LGELEYLPVADSTVDVVISNCVINLVLNKSQVFSEVFRVLNSGGRICISDTVTSIPLPESVRSDLKMFAGCIAGATLISDMENMLRENGFCDIKITPKDESKEFIKEWAPGTKIEDLVKSAIIEAKKP
jgi:SAM-dependent methyltransferase